jgi:hypothetical protein
MSGKRFALILALALSVGLMGATKSRYGAFQVAGTGQYGVAGGPQTITKIFTVGQTNSSFASWSAAAQKVDCSATWAWDEVSSNYLALAWTDSAAAGAGVQARYDDLARTGYGDCSQSRPDVSDRKFPTAGAFSNKYSMVYFPFESSIPAGATIISAQLIVARPETQSMGGTVNNDSLWAVLDTLAADRRWFAGPNTGDNSAKFAGKRAASWGSQVQKIRDDDSTYVNHRAGYTHAGNDTFAWTPALSTRRRPMDWGVRGLGYVVTDASATFNTADSTKCFIIDVKRPVQYAVSGARNSGFWMMYSSVDQTRDGYLRLSFNPTSALRRPFLKVTYSSTQYNGGPWGGKEVGFAFTTDDGKDDANAVYSAVFKARGLSYTMFVNQSRTEAQDTLWSTYANLLQYWQDGIEIASHGRQHPPTTGFLNYTDNSILVSGAAIDSLAWCMSPSWIDSGLAAVSGVDAFTLATMTASPTCGKTIAGPQGSFSLTVLGKAWDAGYYGYRTAGNGIANYSGGFIYRPAPGDTCGTGTVDLQARNTGLTAPQKQNNYIFRLGPMKRTADAGIDQFTMNGATKITDEDGIKRSVRGFIDQAAANNNEYMVWLSHARASNPLEYSGLIDGDQLGWCLDAMAEAGNVEVTNFSTLSRQYRAGMVQVDHPAWGRLEWQSAIKAGGSYPFWGIARASYTAPAPATPAAADTHYTIVATSPMTPRAISLGNRAVCWPSAPTDSVKVGVAWAQLKAGATALRDSSGWAMTATGTGTSLGYFRVIGDSELPQTAGTCEYLYMPYTVPTGRKVDQALLFLYVPSSGTNAGIGINQFASTTDTFFVFSDLNTTNHSLWWTTTGRASIWSTYPTASPYLHRANASYNHITGGHAAGPAWSPTLDSLDNSYKIGPSVSLGTTGIYNGFIGFDVTALISGGVMFPFRFLYKNDLDDFLIAHPDNEIKAKRPFLLVKTVPE